MLLHRQGKRVFTSFGNWSKKVLTKCSLVRILMTVKKTNAHTKESDEMNPKSTTWKTNRIYSNGRSVHRTSVKTWQHIPCRTAR